MTDDQLTQADLSALTKARRYSEIETLRQEGRFNVPMGGEAPLDPDRRLTKADVNRMFAEKRYAEIESLRASHKLDHLLDPDLATHHQGER